MYKSCPEHPDLAEILQNGAKKAIKIANTQVPVWLENWANLQVLEEEAVAEQEFLTILSQRKAKTNPQK